MNFDTSDLPEEVEELLRPRLLKEVLPIIDTISSFIAERRDDAINGRASSGCEAVWSYCEEAYAGIDDANRSEMDKNKWYKPMSMEGPLTTGQGPVIEDRRSTVFVGMTQRYVITGAAKLTEIIISPDDRSFSIEETPDPELIKAKGNKSQIVSDTGVPLTRPAKPEELPKIDPATGGAPPAGAPLNSQGPVPAAGGSSGPPPPAAAGSNVVPFPPGVVGGMGGAGVPPSQEQTRVPLTVADLAQEKIEFAREKAKRAEDRIARWMTESNYSAENRTVIFTAAKLGVGILKAPFPKILKGIKVSEDGKDVQIEEKLIPGAKSISPWDFFPDPTCGECVHNGEYVFERDRITEKQVRDLEKLPGYIKSQLARVLEEGPSRANIKENQSAAPGTEEILGDEKYTIFYYYGTLKRDEVETIDIAMGRAKTKRTSPEDMPEIMYVIATLINNHLVKVTFNPLNSGKFPYHAMPWQPRAGCWWGTGVAEQIMAPQRMLNAGVRSMLDNAGVSCGAQIVIDQKAIYPADDDWTIVPNKIWYKSGDGLAETVEEAFQVFNIPNLSRQILEMIQFFLRLGEESTSIPLVTQGQTGQSTPETLGGMQLQNTNANSLLRSIGYIYDDFVTEPAVYQYYEWYLLDPDVKDEDKAMFHINAHGSVTLVDRAIQDQTLPMLKPFADDPSYGMDKKKFMRELLRSKRFDPTAFMNSQEEQKKIESAPPPEMPQITAAKISSESDIKVALIQAETKGKTDINTTSINEKALALEEQKIQVNATMELHKMQLDREIQLLKYANQHKISVVAAQAQLAGTAMKLKVQEDLSALSTGADLHKHHNPQMKSEAEPAGRAPKGEGFTK